jgi:hypothetical protein
LLITEKTNEACICLVIKSQPSYVQNCIDIEIMRTSYFSYYISILFVTYLIISGCVSLVFLFSETRQFFKYITKGMVRHFRHFITLTIILYIVVD